MQQQMNKWKFRFLKGNIVLYSICWLLIVNYSKCFIIQIKLGHKISNLERQTILKYKNEYKINTYIALHIILGISNDKVVLTFACSPLLVFSRTHNEPPSNNGNGALILVWDPGQRRQSALPDILIFKLYWTCSI